MSNLYFNHSYSLRNQTEILELRAEFGIEGYGLYLMLLETIAESETQSINKNLIRGLGLNLNCDIEKLKSIINFCTKLNLFVVKDDFIYSNHLQKHFEKRAEIKEKRAEAGKLGGRPKANAKQKKSKRKANAKQTKPKESKVNESKVNEIESKENIKVNIKEILNFFNETFKKSNKSCVSWEDNAKYWLEIYTLEEVKQAITNLNHPKWFAKEKPSLELMFRKSNKNGKCDYIQSLLDLPERKNNNPVDPDTGIEKIPTTEELINA